MKKNFLSGLAILLPIVLTFKVIMLFVNLLTKPFLGLVQSIFQELDLLEKSFLYLSGQQIVNLTSKFLILITLLLLTLSIGFLAKHFFLDDVLLGINKFIHRIPIVNKIYKAFQEVTETLFNGNKTSFTQVVLVPFPHEETYSIGFITKEALPEGSETNYLNLISVFVPGTPNPTIGFTFLYKRDQLIFVEMKVEEALKFIISCGVNFTELKAKT